MIAALVQYYAEQMMAVAMIGMHRQNVAADSFCVSHSPGAVQHHALAEQRHQCRHRLMPVVNGFRRVHDEKILSFARRHSRKPRHDLPALKLFPRRADQSRDRDEIVRQNSRRHAHRELFTDRLSDAGLFPDTPKPTIKSTSCKYDK
jgi:hypothetical protein